MPPMSPFSWVIWVAIIGAQFFLFAIFVKFKSWRPWPSLFFFVSLKSALSAGLLLVMLFVQDPDLRPALYFYLYWIGSLITQAIEIWIVVQLSHELAGLSASMRRWIAASVPTFAAFNLIWSLFLSLESRAPLSSAIVRVVSCLDKAVTLGWIVTFLTIALIVEFLGVQWPRRARWIAVGLAVELSGSTACTWLSDFSPKSSVISNVKGVIYLSTLLIWTLSLWDRPENPELGLDARTLGAYLETYSVAAKRITARTS
jgi:hypothetical protein